MDNDNEEFGVNEDDLARAYNPYAFRRKQTKDQAALGTINLSIWFCLSKTFKL